jgi:hypothetical protein
MNCGNGIYQSLAGRCPWLWRRKGAAVVRQPKTLVALVLLKAAYLLGVLAMVWLWPAFDAYEFSHAYQRWPRDGAPVFASHFATWDTAHYLYLCEVGYSPGALACAFYPLWPLLVRWFGWLFGAAPLVSGLLLANACSLAAWALFHRLVVRRWGGNAGNWSLVLMLSFPGSLFFQFNYTESLFLLLLMGLWWGLETSRDWWVWLCGCLLPLTRAVGVLTAIPIAFHFLAEALSISARFSPGGESHEEKRTRYNPAGGFAQPVGTSRRLLGNLSGRPLWLMIVPILGWALYLALMWGWTGNPFEGFAAQKHWGVNSITHLWNVPKFVAGFFSPSSWHEYHGSVLDRCSFVLLLYCLPAMWRIDKRLLAWTYVLGVVPAMSGTFVSFTRYLSCAFPVFVTLGVVLGSQKERWPRYLLLTAFVSIHLVLLWRFVNFRWAG